MIGTVVGVARALVLGFCWMTALYAFVASSAFAYLQFIRPRVFWWVGTFADWHATAALVWLGLFVLAVSGDLRAPSSRRWAAAALGGAAALVCVEVVTHAVARLTSGAHAVFTGVAALLPAMGLALVDHVAAWGYVREQRAPADERGRRQAEGRVLAASLGTAMLVSAGYAVLASIGIGGAFEPDLLAAGLARGAAASMLGHLLVFGCVFVVVAATGRAAGGSIAVHYVMLLGVVALAVAALFSQVIGDSVGMTGWAGLSAGVATGVSVALAWGGLRLRRHARGRDELASGADVFLAPSGGVVSHRIGLALAVVLPLAWALAWLAGRIDWDFALLRSGVVVVWCVTFALVYRASPPREVSTAAVAVACGLPLVVYAGWSQTPLQQHALERYAVYNPSYLLTDVWLRERAQASRFDRYLRANTGLTDVNVAPVSIDLGRPPLDAPAAPPPSIFLLVVDSLRADYLAPYNPAVRFTPHLAAFAAENTWFPRVFTRYGGTGLSMPAIWAGSALAHKQYVRPFASMNALEKLVDANDYRRIQSIDHITDALWSRRPDDLELDDGRAEMDFEFCRTVDELGERLGSIDRSRPVFAQTRVLNLHVAAVRHGYVPPDRSYPGFEAPYAYRVELIDACFGRFVERLKQQRLYDHSIVMLTADHGELIGEDGRWGHSYHMFPEVVEVPLFVHVPTGREGPGPDTGAVAYSTDITPTVYDLLGYRLEARGPLAGRSLMDRGAAARARRGHEVLAASYGAVYAVVSRNGRSLYIADAIQGRDHQYTRGPGVDGSWAEAPVDPAVRAVGQLRIRRHVDTVSRVYGLDQTF